MWPFPRPTVNFLGDIVETHIRPGKLDDEILRQMYRAGAADGSRNGPTGAPRESVIAAVHSAGSLLTHEIAEHTEELCKELASTRLRAGQAASKIAPLEEVEREAAEHAKSLVGEVDALLRSKASDAELTASQESDESVAPPQDVQERPSVPSASDDSAESEPAVFASRLGGGPDLRAALGRLRDRREDAEAAARAAREAEERRRKLEELEEEARNRLEDFKAQAATAAEAAEAAQQRVESATTELTSLRERLGQIEEELSLTPELATRRWETIVSVGETLWSRYADGYNARWRWWWVRKQAAYVSPEIEFDRPNGLDTELGTQNPEEVPA